MTTAVTGASGRSVTSHAIELLTGQRPMTLADLLVAEPASFAHLAG